MVRDLVPNDTSKFQYADFKKRGYYGDYDFRVSLRLRLRTTFTG